MLQSVHRSHRTVVLPSILALAAALALGGPVLAHGGSAGPTYRAVVSPSAVAAGTAATTTITLTQLVEDDYYHARELGSVRITPPSGFSLTGASAVRGSTSLPVVVSGGSVTIDNVDLDHAGQTAVVTVQTTIPCGTAGAASWTVVGHQTYRFSSSKATVLPQDPTSQLGTQVAACSLAFVAARGPAAAGVGMTITGAPADPSGPSIQVQLRDGNGSPAAQAGVAVTLTIEPGTGTAGAVLGGTTNAGTDPTGVASFAPTLDRSGHGYELHASAGPGIGDATSGPFDVDDVAKTCTGACSGTDQMADTSATVSATTNGGVLTMSLGLDALDCNNAVNHYYVSTSQVLTFGLTPSAGRKTVTIGLAAASVTKPFHKYEVCFSSPNTSFINKYGATIAAGDPGILPTCKNCKQPTGGPCVLLRWKDRAGNVFVRFSVPMADPRGRI
jgi:hypothetical protein